MGSNKEEQDVGDAREKKGLLIHMAHSGLRNAHREQAQGVVSHRGFGDQPLRAGTHSADRPGIGSTEHI